MIKVTSRKQLDLSCIKELHEVAKYVPHTEAWYGFETDLSKVEKIELLTIKAYRDVGIYDFGDTESIITKGIAIDNVLVSTTCEWNDILYCVSDYDDVSVADSDAFGYSDQVYRVKYLAAPAGMYWDGYGNPIIINKKRK